MAQGGDGAARTRRGPHPRLGRLLEILAEAAVDLPPGADWLDDLSIYAVPLRYADLLDAEPLDREVVAALVKEVGEWADAQLPASD